MFKLPGMSADVMIYWVTQRVVLARIILAKVDGSSSIDIFSWRNVNISSFVSDLAGILLLAYAKFESHHPLVPTGNRPMKVTNKPKTVTLPR